ncbi:MAG: hypothetical protein IPH62_09625 [Ignavibacteriae bacterium]|nr:hypothetical protein [Ignavibacteriota bacterium]
MKDNEYNCRGFKFVDIMEECKKYDNFAKQIDYLKYVKKEWLNDPPLLDPNGPVGLPLDERLDNEINWREEKQIEAIETLVTVNIDDLIWWKGTEGQLIYLYELLVRNNFIDSSQDEKKYVLLSNHFKNKKGERFNNKQMGQAAQNLVFNKNRKPKDADEINDMVNKTFNSN